MQPYIHSIHIYGAPSESLIIIQGTIVGLRAWFSGLCDFCLHESPCPSCYRPCPGYHSSSADLTGLLASALSPLWPSLLRKRGIIKKKKKKKKSSDVSIPLLKWLLIILRIKFKALNLIRPHLLPHLHPHLSSPLSSTFGLHAHFSVRVFALVYPLAGMSFSQLISWGFSLPYPQWADKPLCRKDPVLAIHVSRTASNKVSCLEEVLHKTFEDVSGQKYKESDMLE